MLWGWLPKQYLHIFDKERNKVLTAEHPVANSRKAEPSPENDARIFLNCHHFLEANNYLVEHGKGEINWSIPDQ